LFFSKSHSFWISSITIEQGNQGKFAWGTAEEKITGPCLSGKD
jgi:hypothetical protein